MSYVAAAGAASMGVVIGWLVRYFIRRFKKFGPGILSSVVSIMLGGVVVKFLKADQTVWWFYPIGLLIGFVIYQVIVMLDPSAGSGSGGVGKGRGLKIPSSWGSGNPRWIRKP